MAQKASISVQREEGWNGSSVQKLQNVRIKNLYKYWNRPQKKGKKLNTPVV